MFIRSFIRNLSMLHHLVCSKLSFDEGIAVELQIPPETNACRLSGRRRYCRRNQAFVADRSGPPDGSRAFVSSGVPERSPGGRGWPGLSRRMKGLIRTKSTSQGRDWAVFVHPDGKKGSWGPRQGDGLRCS
jgi:hypothetical protein